jgi:light-independent protochlorophyllide reductase subunit B
MMGLEEHLIGMFRGDAEFHADAAPSHLGGKAMAARPAAPAQVEPPALEPIAAPIPAGEATVLAWAADAQKELQKIPFFVRGKARRNTERYASERGLPAITVETLYDAKAHFGR